MAEKRAGALRIYPSGNAALADGDIDVNSFSISRMEEMKRPCAAGLTGKTVLMPLGVYSETVKSLDAIKNGMTVAIPTIPVGARAALLQDRGLIEVDPPAPPDVTKTRMNLSCPDGGYTDSIFGGRHELRRGVGAGPARDACSSRASAIAVREGEIGRSRPWSSKLQQRRGWKAFAAQGGYRLRFGVGAEVAAARSRPRRFLRRRLL